MRGQTSGPSQGIGVSTSTDSLNEAAVGELLHRRGWRKAFSVEEMVTTWRRLVEAVERGSAEDLYEYTNELCSRNWLHEAWLHLDDTTVFLWSPHIKELDHRFMAATVYDDGLALDRLFRIYPAEMWWWRRHPRLLTGPLGRELRAAGAVGPDTDDA